MSNECSTVEQLSLGRAVLLHLTPGLLTVSFFIFVGTPIASILGYPPLFAFLLSVCIILIPAELGFLLYLGKKHSGALSLRGIVLYRKKLKNSRLALVVVVLFVWAVLVIETLSFLDRFVFNTFFSWAPEWFLFEKGHEHSSTSVLIGIHVASIFISGFLGPITEELYFHGYLLPRLSRFGWWAPVINTILFNLYHFWSPWRLVTRTIFGLPTAIAIQKNKNISIGIWWHCLGNALGELLALNAVLHIIRL